jgi:hypothetical protein
MKLSKQKKRRVQGYLDMLEYNADVISLMGEDDRLYRIEILTEIYDTDIFKSRDKEVLNLMETIYHRWHLSKMEIYNPK